MPPAASACLGTFAILALWDGRGALAYLARRPEALGPESLSAILSQGLAGALLAGLFALSARALGARGLALLGRSADGPEREAAAFALGAGVWAQAFFLLAAAGSLNAGSALALAAALAAAGWRAQARRPGARWAYGIVAGARWAYGIAAGVLAFALWRAAVAAAAPVSDYDALVSHLALPRLYLSAGGLVELPWLYMSHFPHLMSLLYAFPLALGLESGAAWLHWAAFVALLWTVFRVAREELGPAEAWLAAAALSVQPVLLEYAGAPRVECWWSLFHALGFAAAWRWSRGGGDAGLVLAGVFTGLAASSKLMGLGSLGVLCAWLLVQRRRGRPRERARAAALVAAVGLALAAPWAIKNALLAGDPAWPWLTGLFGDRFGAAALAERVGLTHRWPSWDYASGLLGHLPQALLVPLAVLVPAALAAGRPLPPFLAFQWATFLPYAAVTVWNLNAWRYWVAWIPAMAMTAAWAAAAVWRRGGAWRALAAAAVAVLLWPAAGASVDNALFGALRLRSQARPDLAPREAYLEKAVEPYAFLAAVNRWHEAAGRPPARLFLYSIDRGYHLEVPYLWGDPFLQGLVSFGELPDARALGERLAELGVTHAVVDEGQRVRFFVDRRADALVAELLRREGRLVLAKAGYRLYELRAGRLR